MSERTRRSGRIPREQAALAHVLAEVRAELEHLEHGSDGETRTGELAARLGALRPHLRRHFLLEEQDGGLVTDERGLDHGTQRGYEEFRRQHRELEDRLDALLAAVEHPGDVTRAVLRDVRAFLARLDRHEHAEIDLVQRLYADDVGTGD